MKVRSPAEVSRDEGDLAQLGPAPPRAFGSEDDEGTAESQPLGTKTPIGTRPSNAPQARSSLVGMWRFSGSALGRGC